MAKKVSSAAAEMAKARWADTTPEERSEDAKHMLASKYKGKSEKERSALASAVASKAAKARWGKKTD